MTISSTRRALAISAFALVAACSTASVADTRETRITEAEVLLAQKAWGEALVTISRDYDTAGLDKARATAGAVLDKAYGYDLGPVLFKPTLARDPQTFRTTREGALAYFVGHDPKYPHDAGFALKHWRSVEIHNGPPTGGVAPIAALELAPGNGRSGSRSNDHLRSIADLLGRGVRGCKRREPDHRPRRPASGAPARSLSSYGMAQTGIPIRTLASRSIPSIGP